MRQIHDTRCDIYTKVYVSVSHAITINPIKAIFLQYINLMKIITLPIL